MDEKDWLILKTIAEEKNITKAALRLYISQPALTYRLKNIEEQFGAQVVSRLPSGVVLTPQGEFLVDYAREMLLNLEQVRDRVRNMDKKVQGSLRMGAYGVFAHYVLPRMFKGFMSQYPDVEISLKTGLSYQIVRMLEKQEITVGIVRGEHEWSGERFLLSEEPVCLVSREKLAHDELLKKPHIRYSTDTSLQKMLDDWWRITFKAPPHTTMEVNTMDTARQMVLHGLGWTILPMIGLPKTDSLFTEALFWPDEKPLVRNTWVLCSSAALQFQTVSAFLEYLKKWQLTES